MIETFPMDTPICLDEDPQNQMNSKKNFHLFNKIALTERISRRTSDKFFLLDYAKCKKLLNKLNKEEQYDEQKDLLKGI
jgi:oligoribonuclease NrnB/cAMP/cGMP phosphodiesterase (DHH superfamily)